MLKVSATLAAHAMPPAQEIHALMEGPQLNGLEGIPTSKAYPQESALTWQACAPP